MNTKHTPGPWKARTFNYPHGAETRIEPEDSIYTVATIFISSIAPEEVRETDKANVRLITAAPELLQMVYDLKKCIKRLTEDNLLQFQKDAEAEWIGEAHELLMKVEPDYYRNANQK